MVSNGLLKGLWLDPVAFVERVLLHVQDQLSQDHPVGNGYQPLDQWLVATLGDRLAGLIAKEDLSIGERSSARLHRNDAPLKEVIARDAVLAAALGACECWGRRPDCPICEGEGTPGWILPDEQLYARFVHPAVSVVRDFNFRTGGIENYGKEFADVKPDAG